MVEIVCFECTVNENPPRRGTGMADAADDFVKRRVTDFDPVGQDAVSRFQSGQQIWSAVDGQDMEITGKEFSGPLTVGGCIDVK